MALRALQGPTGGGTPVGGTGTPNTIPRWTGPSTLGDSQLKDNGTLVGIGASLTSGNRLVIGGVASGTSFIKANEATFQIGNIFAGPVQILTSDTPQVTVTGTGNVGIGTASPPYRLSVTASAAQIGAFSTTDANSGFLEWRYGGGNAGYIGNGSSILTGASATDFIVRSAGALKFATNGNNLRATIDASGNVYGTSGTTGMTDGFFYIPGAAGAPTGTPTAVAGRVPMYYDTTNNEFYVYNGAWKKVALA